MLVFEKELDQLIVELEKELEKLMKMREGLFLTGEIDKRVAKIRTLLVQYHNTREKLKTSPKSLRILHWLMSLISKILALNNELDIKRISRPGARRIGGKSSASPQSQPSLNSEFFDSKLIELVQKFLGNEVGEVDSMLSPEQRHHRDLLHILDRKISGEGSLVIDEVRQLYLQQIVETHQQGNLPHSQSSSAGSPGFSLPLVRITIELSIIALAMELATQIAMEGAKSASYAAQILAEGVGKIGGHSRT